MSDPLLQIGFVHRAHGLRGEVKVQLFDADSLALEQSQFVWLGPSAPDGDAPRASSAPSKIAAAAGGRAGQAHDKRRLRSLRRIGDGLYIALLDGVTDRDLAEQLQGLGVYVDRSQLPQLDEDEYYVSDTVGYKVQLPDGTLVGTVRSTLETAGNSLMVISRPAGAEALVPMVPQIVQSVSPEERTVVIDPPEGLLDLNEPGAAQAADGEG
jgi:16S rRNA processing protein RimM